MFSRISSAVCSGIEGRCISVETDVARGLPGIFIVGLASTMVMESRERIKSAITNSGLEYPRGRITVNLTPAYFRKTGSCLDLPIAAGILAAGSFIDPARASSYGLMGELSLDGRIHGVSGVLPMLSAMQKSGIGMAVIPADNAREATLISGMKIFTASSLEECCRIIETGKGDTVGECDITSLRTDREGRPDFSDIRGQEAAKRAITIAAAGGHGLLMVGSPGCGKTMLASRIPSILPEMDREELTETVMIYSAAGKLDPGKGPDIERPFRAPHHTIGRAGLIGGGMIPVPGEITLAHNGVLFLDEVCEYSRDVIEGLRTPMEEHRITHFRKGENYTFPSRFQLVMASNPCPCGYHGDPEKPCRCSEAQLMKYRKKLSGPLMDRVDMRISMERVLYEDLNAERTGTGSEEMKRNVMTARDFAVSQGRRPANSLMDEKDMSIWCRLGEEESSFMDSAYTSLGMSPRSYKRALRVARTIADMDKSSLIRIPHLAEALSYRIMERVN